MSSETSKKPVSSTPLLDELVEYAHMCLQDVHISKYEDYISCTKHKWACQRFLNDIERSRAPDSKFEWNEYEAQRIVDWFGYLKHSKGVLAGQFITLNKWQKFLLCQLYGWRRRDTGHKRFHKLFAEVGRKNARFGVLCGNTWDYDWTKSVKVYLRKHRGNTRCKTLVYRNA